jgi:outer membrane protein TolC
MRVLTLFIVLILQVIHCEAQRTDLDYQREIFQITHILNHSEVLDSLVRQAEIHSGVLKAMNDEMLLYQEEALQKRRNWISSFRLGVNIFSATTNVNPENQSVTTYGVLPNLGLTLSIDPENLVNRKSQIRQAEQKYNRSMHLREDHHKTLKNRIVGLYYDYLTLLECLVVKEKTLETRRQHAMVMEVEFKNGTATYDQLLIVQNQLHLMEEELIKEQMEVLKKKKEIDIILGAY